MHGFYFNAFSCSSKRGMIHKEQEQYKKEFDVGINRRYCFVSPGDKER